MLCVGLCVTFTVGSAGAAPSTKLRIPGTRFFAAVQHRDGEALSIEAPSDVGSGEIEIAISTLEGALAGAGVKGALVETAGKVIVIYLPTMPKSNAYIQNALRVINEGASKFNLYSIATENWSEYSVSGKPLARGAEGIGAGAFITLRAGAKQRFTVKMLKALSTRPWVRGVLISIGNETPQRVVVIDAIVSEGVNVSTAYLVGLFAAQTSSEVGSYLVTVK